MNREERISLSNAFPGWRREPWFCGARTTESCMCPVRRNFREGLKNVKVVILDQCGHVPFFEKRKETTKAYQDFLAGG